ncbi:MAG TPA: tetratricopeptide repeat protein [Thermoanaerobaculia bacterium]|nr:tetratricopeptide repeat protein [Thermoanaerobaculia bacterium]
MRRSFRSVFPLSLVVLAALAALAAAAPPNLPKTLEAQRQLAAERPQDAGVWNDLGNLLLLARRPGEAEEAYRRAVELDPERVSALFNLGLLLQQKAERHEALELFGRVIEREPRHAWSHYQKGAIYEAWGRDAQAVRWYAEAFALDPQLAFPDVNPHVLDNKLLTQAMLRAYRQEGQAPQAPSLYEDPQRIASLLVPPPLPSQERQEVAATDEPAATAAPAGAAGQPTVLRERNLERGRSSGQVSAPGSAGRRAPSAPSRPGGGVRTWSRPEPNIQPEIIEEGIPEQQFDPESPEVYVPPGGVVYAPGVFSSGRLDTQLLPSGTRLAAAGRRK